MSPVEVIRQTLGWIDPEAWTGPWIGDALEALASLEALAQLETEIQSSYPGDVVDNLRAMLTAAEAARDRYRELLDQTHDGAVEARAERNRYREALERVKNRKNQVCTDYMDCTHPVCSSSYEAFVIADTALSEVPDER